MNRIETIVICDAVRTPFTHGKQYREETPVSLLASCITSLLDRNSLSGNAIDGVIAGTVLHDWRWTNVARMASLSAGLPQQCADFSVQGNCNSGFVAVQSAIGEIMIGNGSLYIAGGTEQMSSYGFAVKERGSETIPDGGQFIQNILDKKEKILDDIQIADVVQEILTDNVNNLNMAEVAEIMANYFGISREEQDRYARESLVRAIAAQESGYLNNYTIPIGEITHDTYPSNRKRLLRKEDSYSRASAIYDMDDHELSPKYFVQKNRTVLEPLGIKEIAPSVTMYNATVPGDGAGAALITTEQRAKELGLTPKIRIINWAKAGVDPVLMGIGPVEAVHSLFSSPRTIHAEMVTFDQIDILEIHEAFAAQALSVFQQSDEKYHFQWKPEKVNRYGGSLAYTHPLGATNSRLITNILSRFDEEDDAQYALAASCAGGGMGAAMLFERY